MTPLPGSSPWPNYPMFAGRKVRGVVMCNACETPEEKTMAGYFLMARSGTDNFACERCGKKLSEVRP